MTPICWDAAAAALATYARLHSPGRRRGAAVIGCDSQGTWLIGLFGADAAAGRRVRPALADLLARLGLRDLGFGLDRDGPWWGLLARPGPRHPRSFLRDRRQGARLAAVLDAAVDLLCPGPPADPLRRG
jgi:hypothetical protein